MKLNVKTIDKIVGLFILLAVIGLVVILIFLGLNQRWFKKNVYFYSKFNSAKSLIVGMPITLSGFEIGKVDNIDLNPREKIVILNFYIYEEFYETSVTPNSIIELVSSPIGLGSGLVFHPGLLKGEDDWRAIPEGDYIPAYNTEDGLSIAAKGLVDRSVTDDSIGSLLSQVNPIMQQIPPILFALKNVLVDVDEAFKGTRESQLGRTLFSVTGLLSSMNKSLTEVNSVLGGTSAGPAGNILNNLSEVSDTMNEAVLEQSRKLAALMENVKGITANLEKISGDPTGLVTTLINPGGSIKTFLDDGNVLFDNVQGMFEDVRAIIGELEKFSRFISSTTPQISGILETGKETLSEGQNVLEGLKNNPLIKGGITEKKDQPSTFSSYREEDF